MKDIFSEYKKSKIKLHAGLLGIATLFAIGINLLLHTSSNNFLSANMLAWNEIPENSTENSDIIFRENNNILEVSSQKNMINVQSLSFSLAYNPDLLSFDIQNLQSNFIVQVLENDPGYTTFLLQSSTGENIESGEKILEIPFSRNGNEVVFINPIEINFSNTSWEISLLRSKNIMIP